MLQATDEMPLAILDNPDGREEFFRYEAGINSIIADLPEVIFGSIHTLPRYGTEIPCRVTAPSVEIT